MTTTQQTDIGEILTLVQRFARRFLRDPYDAEELAQEVLIKVLVAERRNPAIGEWNHAQRSAWLLLITRRTAIDMVRRAKLYTLHNMELADCHIAPGAIESNLETCELLDAALSQLPASQRSILLLAAQGYRSKEIEQREQVTAAAVKGRLTRARAALVALREEWNAA